MATLRETVTEFPPRQATPPVPANQPDHTRGIARNPGMKLDLGFLESMRSVNRSALERRVGDDDQAPFDQGRQPGRLAA
jgi:deoxyribose-phosphate aldolase